MHDLIFNSKFSIIKKIIVCLSISIIICYCGYFVFNILKLPLFFFSDQHDHILKILGIDRSILKRVPSRFDILAYVEYYPILVSCLSYQKIMALIYVVESLKVICMFIAVFLLSTLVSNIYISVFIFFIFLACGSFVALMPTLAHTIFLEPIVVLFVCLFFIFYIQASKTDRTIFYILASFCAVIATYYKEPTFSIFLILAVVKSIFHFNTLKKKEKWFFGFLLLNTIVFFTAYIIFSYSPGESYLAGQTMMSPFNNAKFLLKSQPYIIVNFFIICIRFLQCILKKKIVINLPDIFLLSSVAYFTAYVILNLNATYYFIPAYTLSLLSYAGYSYQLYMLSKQYTLMQNVFLIAYMSVFLVCSVKLYEKTLKFDEYTYWDIKIITQPYTAFMDNLITKGYQVKSFLPDFNKFDFPFKKHAASWSLYTTNIFYNFYTQQKMFYRIPLIEDGNTFLAELDNNVIGRFSPVQPIDPYPWAYNSNYKVIDLYFTRFVYNKKYEEDVKVAYCKFINDVRKASNRKNQELFETLYAYAKDMKCTLGGKQIPLNIDDLTTIKKALEAYRNDFGSYPLALEWQAYAFSKKHGKSKGALWIDGLVPKYLSEIPHDLNSKSPDQAYIYRSDGKDYKLLVHSPRNMDFLKKRYPDRVDPIRPDWAAGYWTVGAKSW